MNLQLSLKKNWYDLTKSGIKSEDYREITPYWYNRLVDRENINSIKKAQLAFYVSQLENQEGLIKEFLENAPIIFKYCFKKFTHNTMTLGYPKSGDTERILKLEHKGIEIRTGNPEFGAEPNKLYFVIKHGEIIT